MIELAIIQYLMEKESQSTLRRGRLVGWNIAWIREQYGIPKATFYRRVNMMLDQGFLTKQKRGYYILSDGFRQRANGMKTASDITR